MFCSNCGHKMNDNDEFCSECGTKRNNFNNDNTVNNQDEILSQSNTIQQEEPIKTKKQPSISLKKHKRAFLISIIILILVICSLVIFNLFYEKVELSWNENYTDTKLNYVTQTDIQLGINFSLKDKLDQVKYKTTCGEIKNNGYELNWNLTDSIGKCQLTASYKNKKITKEYTVMPFDINEKELSLEDNQQILPDEDLDFDGLTNEQEKEYKTNPLLSDSDMDGLNDYEEIFTYKTNPNKKDTDKDGLSDYDEIKLGLDPLKDDSKNDGIKDGKRTLTYELSSTNLKMVISGTGNIASTKIEISPNTKISSKPGLIDNLLTFYTDGNLTEATVVINYNMEELEKYGLNEDNLSLFYYNEKTSTYEKIATTIDKTNKTLTAKLKHFSSYVVGDTSKINKETTNQILFVLDNSWSMYTEEQYKEITGKDYNGGLFAYGLDGSDKDGLRFTLTSDLITKLSKDSNKFGLSEFRSDYASLYKIGGDKNEIKEKLKNMNGKFTTQLAGTDISTALNSGMNEFDYERFSDNKYIILLTDGEDSSLKYNTQKIVEKALQNKVKICSIGFGKGASNAELSNISNATGCKFYSSEDANGLSELFENVGAELNDDLIDIDNDNKVDGILIADSGFVVNKDGFSFDNYISTTSTGGHCYGMAVFAELYYKKLLPLELGEKTVDKDTSHSYNLKNSYFKNYKSLYGYKLQTNDLKYSFGFESFNEETPSNFRIVENDSLIYSKEYTEKIEASGIYKFPEPRKSTLSKKKQQEKHGLTYSTYVEILLDEEKMQKKIGFNNEDRQLFNAIYASFIKQDATVHYSSGTDFILWARNVVGTEETGYTGAPGFINILKTRLKDKDAPVIASNFSGGLHAINAINLIQDINNPNHYYIGVYDNNYSGEKRYVEIECNQKTCVTKANSYYSESNQPIRISPSIEYDLEYYK